MKYKFDEILHYEGRAEFFQIFGRFFGGGQWSFKKKKLLIFTDLYLHSYFYLVKLVKKRKSAFAGLIHDDFES